MRLVLIRHGESVWNKDNKFTGWTDVELSEKGIIEAKEAGKKLKENNFTFDIAYTSVLKRAVDTLKYILEELNINIPVIYTWKLNERHYGALQGLNKDEMKKKYGEEMVKMWRRSYNVKPPLLNKTDERYPGNDLKYKELNENELPLGESLEDTLKRTVEYFDSHVKKVLLQNKDIIIVAHGNSLRALVKYLEDISDEDIVKLEIPTGKPYVYELNENLEILNKYYL